LNVRPKEEYDVAHIPGAISIPIEELEEKLASLPSNCDVVAYCRGPYCLMSVEAVKLLKTKAKRLRSVARKEDNLMPTKAAGAALFVGHLSQRFGRRSGLATGFLIGGLGAIGVVISALTNNILLLMFSLLIYGAGTATNLQTRYAGTDLAAPTQRATAISIAMVSTTFGAVAGPNLVNVMGKFAESIGVPALAEPFILAAAAYIVAGLILLALLRSDPLVVAKALAEALSSTPSHPDHSTGNTASFNKKGVIIGATVISRCLDRVGRSIW